MHVGMGALNIRTWKAGYAPPVEKSWVRHCSLPFHFHIQSRLPEPL